MKHHGHTTCDQISTFTPQPTTAGDGVFRQAKSDWPTYSPGPAPGGTAKIAELVNWRYSIIASLEAIAFCSGMKCVAGSRTNATKKSPASSPPRALDPSTKL